MSNTRTSATPQLPSDLGEILNNAGVYFAHHTNSEVGTGISALLFPEGAICAADVRGGAPATRETDLLDPSKTIQEAHAVVLSGGSAYGLAASTGVAEALEKRGIGVNVGSGVVPIVVSACVFDLECGSFDIRPDASYGYEAVQKALDLPNSFELGNIGAGTGCTVAKFAGRNRAMKSGFGIAYKQAQDLWCVAFTAVNACGDIVDPATGTTLCGVLSEDGSTPLTRSIDVILSNSAQEPLPRTNTTISCVATNAHLTQAEAQHVATMAHDAYARTIQPVHTPFDGDTIFIAATGHIKTDVTSVGCLATQALEDAIVQGAVNAQNAYGYTAYNDLV